MVSFCESCKHYRCVNGDEYCLKIDDEAAIPTNKFGHRCDSYDCIRSEDWYLLGVDGMGCHSVSMCNGNYFVEDKSCHNTDNLVFLNKENAEGYIKNNDINIKCHVEPFKINKDFASMLIKGEI